MPENPKRIWGDFNPSSFQTARATLCRRTNDIKFRHQESDTMLSRPPSKREFDRKIREVKAVAQMNILDSLDIQSTDTSHGHKHRGSTNNTVGNPRDYYTVPGRILVHHPWPISCITPTILIGSYARKLTRLYKLVWTRTDYSEAMKK